MTRPALLDEKVVEEWLVSHPSWRVIDGHLSRVLHTTDYPSAVRLVQAQVALAERLDHHPVLTVGYREVRFELWTHDRGGLTRLDLAYAEALDELVTSQFSHFVVH